MTEQHTLTIVIDQIAPALDGQTVTVRGRETPERQSYQGSEAYPARSCVLSLLVAETADLHLGDSLTLTWTVTR